MLCGRMAGASLLVAKLHLGVRCSRTSIGSNVALSQGPLCEAQSLSVCHSCTRRVHHRDTLGIWSCAVYAQLGQCLTSISAMDTQAIFVLYPASCPQVLKNPKWPEKWPFPATAFKRYDEQVCGLGAQSHSDPATRAHYADCKQFAVWRAG